MYSSISENDSNNIDNTLLLEENKEERIQKFNEFNDILRKIDLLKELEINGKYFQKLNL